MKGNWLFLSWSLTLALIATACSPNTPQSTPSATSAAAPPSSPATSQPSSSAPPTRTATLTPIAPFSTTDSAPAPTVITAVAAATDSSLKASRDLTGTWKGKGVYYYASLGTGERLLTVTVDVTLTIRQSGNDVTAQMEQKVVKQEPPGGATVGEAFLSAEDWSGPLKGFATITDLYLETTSTAGYKDVWTLTFTTDLMSGGVRTEPNGEFYACLSDVKAFALARQK